MIIRLFSFIISKKSKGMIKYLIRFNYPVFMDSENKINARNHFPNKPEYYCFLLDKKEYVDKKRFKKTFDFKFTRIF
jgi:hypothetical protein